VAIEIMTDEMHQINYLDGLDELIEAINLQTDGPREAARAIRKKLQYGSVHCQLHALCILEALVEEAGPKFRSSFLNRRLWKRLRFCARADLSSPRVKEKCRVIFRSWNIKYSSTPGLAVLCSLYHVSCFNRNEVVEALTCCCSKFLVLTVLLKQRSKAGAVVSQKLLFNFWQRGCQHWLSDWGFIGRDRDAVFMGISNAGVACFADFKDGVNSETEHHLWNIIT
jgi:hypothetical protein